MKKHCFLAFFLLLFSSSYAQPNTQGNNRVHIIVKQAIAKTPGLVMYGRRNSSKLVNIAVLNTATRTMSWFTCHGRFFDSASLTIEECRSIATNAADPFVLYQNICNEYLADIKTVKNIYRLSGRQDALRYAHATYQAVFASHLVNAAKTPLQKLMAIENMQRNYLLRLAYFNCNAPTQLANDSAFSIPEKMLGAMVKTNDSTVFYNIDPVSAINKIVLYTKAPEKLYVYNRQVQLVDSVPLLPGKYNLLLKEKTDVFLLYRGWLEMQWQEAAKDALQVIKNRQTDTLPELYRHAYKQDDAASLTAIYRKLHTIDMQTDAAILPEVKVVEQAVYEQYKSEPFEIMYAPGIEAAYTFTTVRGQKAYELTNHLGNVLATVSDRRAAFSNDNTTVDHYEPVVLNATDYYPFGMEMPGRVYNGAGYRYGFNGKENDNEVKGEGNQQDYGMRIYDPRVARFLSVDPLMRDYPWNSTYAYAENSPILFKDLDGLERVNYLKTVNSKGQTILRYQNTTDFYVYKWNPHWGGTKLGFTLWDLQKDPYKRFVTHEPTDGTVERFDKVQFVVYDQTISYDSYADMIHNRNGSSGNEKAFHYLAKGMQNAKEENTANGGAGMAVNLYGKSASAGAKLAGAIENEATSSVTIFAGESKTFFENADFMGNITMDSKVLTVDITYIEKIDVSAAKGSVYENLITKVESIAKENGAKQIVIKGTVESAEKQSEAFLKAGYDVKSTPAPHYPSHSTLIRSKKLN